MKKYISILFMLLMLITTKAIWLEFQTKVKIYTDIQTDTKISLIYKKKLNSKAIRLESTQNVAFRLKGRTISYFKVNVPENVKVNYVKIFGLKRQKIVLSENNEFVGKIYGFPRFYGIVLLGFFFLFLIFFVIKRFSYHIEDMKIKPRLYSLDLFRAFIAIMVLLFHAQIHGIWGIKNEFIRNNISLGAVYMDAFFILSGFLLCYLYEGKMKLNSPDDIKLFLFKRFIHIYPNYIVYMVVSIILFPSIFKKDVFFVNFLCLQSFFPTLWNYNGNGGLWFISCICLCYLLFPISIWISQKFSFKVVLCVLYFLIFFSNNINGLYSQIGFYYSPIYRFLIFFVGVEIAKIHLERRFLFPIKMLLCLLMFLCILFGFLPKMDFVPNVKFGYNYTFYAIFSVPLFSILILCLVNINNISFCRFCKTRFIDFLSKISYSIYLWQGLPLGYKIIFNGECSLVKLVLYTLSFAACAYFIIEKPGAKLLKKWIG